VKLSRTTSLRSAGAVAAAALLLSSCGQAAPGVAADVEGDQITDEQVDDFAEVLCAIGGVAGTESGVPTKTARFASLQILMANELTADIADLDAVPRQSVATILEGMSAARETLSEAQQETFDEVAEEFARAQTAVVELGREALAVEGRATEIPDEEAYAEGQRLLAEHAEGADIEVDPRFGEVVDGALQPSSGSLSVPVSDFAVQGAAAEAGEGLVSLLPASQKCESPS
jgi:hypothetical protein